MARQNRLNDSLSQLVAILNDTRFASFGQEKIFASTLDTLTKAIEGTSRKVDGKTDLGPTLINLIKNVEEKLAKSDSFDAPSSSRQIKYEANNSPSQLSNLSAQVENVQAENVQAENVQAENVQAENALVENAQVERPRKTINAVNSREEHQEIMNKHAKARKNSCKALLKKNGVDCFSNHVERFRMALLHRTHVSRLDILKFISLSPGDQTNNNLLIDVIKMLW